MGVFIFYFLNESDMDIGWPLQWNEKGLSHLLLCTIFYANIIKTMLSFR